MILLQAACVGIVLVYAALRVHADRGFPARFALLALAGLVGEDTMIRAYGFYAYAPSWWCFVDRVPLLIVVIWPVVIDSADALARALLGKDARDTDPRVAGLASAIVLFDAALIEPVAVRAGLWAWTAPGAFGVPPVGVLGWGFFALFVLLLLPRLGRLRPLVLLLAPAATHLALVVSWWAALRWMRGVIAPWAAAMTALILGATLAALAWRRNLRARVRPRVLLLRAPGALFFFVLLAAHAREVELVVYAVAFAPPYLALLEARGARALGENTP